MNQKLKETIAQLELKFEEKRGNPRRAMRLDFKFLQLDPKSDQYIEDEKREDPEANIYDISHGGVAIDTSIRLNHKEAFLCKVMDNAIHFMSILQVNNIKKSGAKRFSYGCSFLDIL